MPCKALKVTTSTLNYTWKYTSNQCSSHMLHVLCIWCYMCCVSGTIYYLCSWILHQLNGEKFLNGLQGLLYVDHVTILLPRSDKAMSYREQGLPVQVWVKLVHHLKMCKGPPSHTCHLLIELEPQVQVDSQIVYQVYLGQCNPIQNSRWKKCVSGRSKYPQTLHFARVESDSVSLHPVSNSLQTLG